MYVCFIYVSYMHMQITSINIQILSTIPCQDFLWYTKHPTLLVDCLRRSAMACHGVEPFSFDIVMVSPVYLFCEPVPSLGPHCIHSFPDADAVTMGYPHDSRCRQLLQPKLAGMQLVLWLIVLPALWHL